MMTFIIIVLIFIVLFTGIRNLITIADCNYKNHFIGIKKLKILFDKKSFNRKFWFSIYKTEVIEEGHSYAYEQSFGVLMHPITMIWYAVKVLKIRKEEIPWEKKDW